MGKHSLIVTPGGSLNAVAPRALSRPVGRPIRRRWQLAALAIAATFGILLVMVIDPYSGAYADAAKAPNHWVVIGGQSYTANGSYSIDVTRDKYGSKAKPHVQHLATAGTGGAPLAGIPSPGSAKAVALAILKSRGMGMDQYSCLVSLWDRESGWSVTAANGSGAYGIPQALPGNKMASAGPNWQTNAKTQILWGLSYISGRYGTPCKAWAHSQSSGWY